ncbi:hypothetical protein BGZ46_006570, partial [Entomortierella lignicola]
MSAATRVLEGFSALLYNKERNMNTQAANARSKSKVQTMETKVQTMETKVQTTENKIQRIKKLLDQVLKEQSFFPVANGQSREGELMDFKRESKTLQLCGENEVTTDSNFYFER